MDQEDELAEWKKKTCQLIGRNVLLFQQMEQLLKDLLPRATNSISFDTDVQVARAERYAEVEKCTLGNLVNLFIDEVCDPDEPTFSDEPDGPRLTLTIRLSFKTSEERDALIERLKDLVEGRNRLVHHLLSEIDVNSLASWRRIHDVLEDQYRQVDSEIKALQKLFGLMAMSGALLVHPEIRRELVYGPMRDQLIEKLMAAARESSEPDGWTSLKVAIKNGHFVSSDVITEFLQGYQIRTISAFLETVGDFEIRHDKDRKGKTRTFYRITREQNPAASDP